MASCFGKNGDNLSAKDYSEKKRNLTLFNILRRKDASNPGFRTNTATVNDNGNIVHYNNHENLINYKKGFEECNKEDMKDPYLGQLFKKNMCDKLIECEKGSAPVIDIATFDAEKYRPVYDNDDEKMLCFNKNNIITKETNAANLTLTTFNATGYVDNNTFFENHKKINYTCVVPRVNAPINVIKDVCK